MSDVVVLNIGQLVTMSGPVGGRVGAGMSDLGLAGGDCLLVLGGEVAKVGTWDEVKGLVPAGCAEVDAKGGLVTPGLVDAHTHAVFAGNRAGEFEQRCAGATYEEISAAGGGILSSVRGVRESDEEGLVRETVRHLGWMASQGTTCAEVKSGYGLDLASELTMLRVAKEAGEAVGVRTTRTFLGAHAVPGEFKGRGADYLRCVAEEMLPEVARSGLAEWCDAFCDPIAFSADECRGVLQAAKERGLKLRLHVDQLSDSGGAALAAELGAKTADHLEFTGSEGIGAMRRAGVVPVLLPGSVYGLGKDRYPAAREMIEAGLPVVLATDFNPGSSPTPSLPFVMSLACTKMGMSPAEALVACTVNAAASLDLPRLGRLEAGSAGDFVVWEATDHREIPYYCGFAPVLHTFVAGTEVRNIS